MMEKGKLAAITVCIAVVAGFTLPRGVHAQQRQGPTTRRARSLELHRPAIPGVHGLVTAGHPLASISGIRILIRGGNAADATVATMATLNVVRPQMSGAAGNGFVTIYDKATDRVYSLGATGAAPLALDPGKMTPGKLNKGIQAGVVPGLFGGWVALLDRFGTMSLAEVLEPAIDYAENGHPIEASVVRSIAGSRSLFEAFPSSSKMFLPHGRLPKRGEMVRMTDLANTLKKLVEAERTALKDGKSRSQALKAAFDRFYTGDIAQEMARFYKENGGDFTLQDFAAYEPIWAEPIHTTYRGYDVYTSPPTSRGGLEVAMQLNLIEGFDLGSLRHNSAQTLHLQAECIKLAKSDIYHYVADPKFTHIPTKRMLSKKYAASRRELIDPDRAMVYPEPGNLRRTKVEVGSPTKTLAAAHGPRFQERSQEGSTTSFSVADQYGNVVACTPTHGGSFGTAVVVGNTGLTFNNGTRIGSTSPYPEDVNYVRGGQIPLLNNSPVIVLKDGKFLLALGTPGGETIGQTQFQVLLNVLDFGMSIQQAIEATRFTLSADPNFYKPGARIGFRIEDRVPAGVVPALKQRGYDVRLAQPYSFGSMQGILMNRETGTMAAGADPRRAAYAIGW